MDEVLHFISKRLNEKDASKLLKNLRIEDDPAMTLAEKLEDVPWFDLKRELEMVRRGDLLVEQIQQNTLITKGKVVLFRRELDWILINQT